jgi:hypothetical protein
MVGWLPFQVCETDVVTHWGEALFGNAMQINCACTMIFVRFYAMATAIALSSCGPSSVESAECPVPTAWSQSFDNYVDTDVFIDVTVTENSYDVNGRAFRDLDGLGKFLREQNAEITSTYSVPAQLLVRSDDALSCQRFQNAAKIIEENYPCERKNVCFSAYGLGKNFLPPIIPPPPSVEPMS